ncbi:MAG: nucleotidyltransferase family protein [Comamonadaceae bacterium]
MLLAAGRGERMRPLTDAVPKPMLALRGKPLMQWAMEALARGGFTRTVINTAWLGEQIEAAFGTVCSPLPDLAPLEIGYSREGADFGTALETAGGIVRALPRLCPVDSSGHGAELFWVLASDVFAPDFCFEQAAVKRFADSGKLAHIWLVPNPEHHPGGDFGLSSDGLALSQATVQYTYSTIGLYRRTLFAPPWCDIAAGNPHGVKAPLAPLLRAAMDNALVSAELYRGAWTDIGTPERLHELNQAREMDRL